MQTPSPATYWRRRFLTLVVGLSTLALLAWAFTAVLGGHKPAGDSHTNGGHTTAGSAHQHTSAGQPDSPGAGTPASTPDAGSSTAAGSTAKPNPSVQARSKDAAASLKPCSPGAVVLSLFSDQTSYTARQIPEFQIDVVSTAARACTFDIGAKYVRLSIAAAGDTIWTSAECAEGEASVVTTLHRGMPTAVPMTWDGQRSSPGCPVPGAPAGSGRYQAVASDGGLRSNTVAFRLG